jgi:hypothetical protein
MKAVPKKLPIDLEITGVTLPALQLALNIEHRQRESLSPNANQTSRAEKPTETGMEFAYTKDPGAPQQAFFRQAIKHTRNIPQVKNSVFAHAWIQSDFRYDRAFSDLFNQEREG